MTVWKKHAWWSILVALMTLSSYKGAKGQGYARTIKHRFWPINTNGWTGAARTTYRQCQDSTKRFKSVLWTFDTISDPRDWGLSRIASDSPRTPPNPYPQPKPPTPIPYPDTNLGHPRTPDGNPGYLCHGKAPKALSSGCTSWNSKLLYLRLNLTC